VDYIKSQVARAVRSIVERNMADSFALVPHVEAVEVRSISVLQTQVKVTLDTRDLPSCFIVQVKQQT
jgi:hypothetical protein